MAAMYHVGSASHGERDVPSASHGRTDAGNTDKDTGTVVLETSVTRFLLYHVNDKFCPHTFQKLVHVVSGTATKCH